MLRNSAYVLSKLILKLSEFEVFEILDAFHLKCFARSKTFAAQNGVKFIYGVFPPHLFHLFFYHFGFLLLQK